MPGYDTAVLMAQIAWELRWVFVFIASVVVVAYVVELGQRVIQAEAEAVRLRDMLLDRGPRELNDWRPIPRHATFRVPLPRGGDSA